MNREILSDQLLQSYGKAAIVYKKNVICHGGYNGNYRLDCFLCIDTIDKKISKLNVNKEQIPKNVELKRDCHSAVLYKNTMLIVMGGNGREWLNDIIAFDPYTKNIYQIESKSTNKPICRAGHLSVVYKDKLYIGFGWSGNKPLNDIWYFDLINCTWHQVDYYSDFEVPKMDSFAYNLFDSDIYIFGGGHRKDTFNQILKFNIPQSTFEKIVFPDYVDFGVSGCVCDYYNDHIYFYGGGKNGVWKNDIIKYNIKSGHLHNINLKISNGYSSTLKIVDGKIYLFGGGTGSIYTDKLSIIKIDDSGSELNIKRKVFEVQRKNMFTDVCYIFF